MADVAYRWNMLLTKLHNQITENRPADEVANTRARIRQFALGTDQQITPLRKPPFSDSCFKGLRFGRPKGTRDELLEESGEDITQTKRRRYYLDSVKIPITTDPVQLGRVILELERLYLSSKQRTREYYDALYSARTKQGRMLASEAAGKVYVPHTKNLRRGKRPPCWCACGKLVNFRRTMDGTPIGIYRFLRGHVARYVSQLIKVERNETRWEDLPVLLKEGLKWIACKTCGGPIPSTDPFGEPLKPSEHIGIACWRERFKKSWPYERKKKMPRGTYSTPARLRRNYAGDSVR